MGPGLICQVPHRQSVDQRFARQFGGVPYGLLPLHFAAVVVVTTGALGTDALVSGVVLEDGFEEVVVVGVCLVVGTDAVAFLDLVVVDSTTPPG